MAKKRHAGNGLGSIIEEARAVPIGEYGFLSDGEVSALVSPAGSIDWMCVPRFDAPSVFGSILGRRAGTFRVAPIDVRVPADVRYLPGTMILETSWGTATGWVIVRDVLLMGPWHHEDDRSSTWRRTPQDYEAEHILLRSIRCVSGEVQMVMDCEPVLDYGRAPVSWEYTGEGYHQGRASAPGVDDVALTLTTDMQLGFEGGQASTRTLLKQGDTRFVALSWGGAVAPTTYDEAYAKLVWTAHHWQHWLARGTFPDHPWRGHLQRSALTLRGLTYSPDRGGDGRRQHLAPGDAGREPQLRLPVQLDPRLDVRAVGDVQPGLRLGGAGLLQLHRRRRRDADDDLQIMYGIGGERDLEEFELDHLPGLRRLPAGAHRQRGVRPAAARRLGGPAGLALPALAQPSTTSTTGSGRSWTSRSARR